MFKNIKSAIKDSIKFNNLLIEVDVYHHYTIEDILKIVKKIDPQAKHRVYNHFYSENQTSIQVDRYDNLSVNPPAIDLLIESDNLNFTILAVLNK
jgi:uncharacterized short protein YbdD (DUF466 family)